MATKGCEHLAANLERCNCTYEPCERKGHCCLCIEYHRGMGQLPACYFSPEAERTYDRSIRRFIEGRKR